MDAEKDYKEILEYLENCYTGARAMDDVEMELRISRAIVAFKADIYKNIFRGDFLPQ